MSCIKLSKTDGKESVLYKELLKALNSESAAEREFSKTTGDKFNAIFGDYVGNYQDSYASDPKMALRVYDNGEPKIFKKKVYKKIPGSKEFSSSFKEYNQYYYKTNNGGKLFLNKIKFPELKVEQIEEVTSHLLHDYVMKNTNASFDNIKSLNPDKILSSIEETINNYKSAIKEDDKYRAEKERRADIILKNKEDFKSEIITKLEELGLNYKQKFINEKGESETEVGEEEKGGGINIKESFESNSKDNASARVKLLLSQITDVTINPEYNKASSRLSKELKLNALELANLRVNVKKGLSTEGLSEQNIKDLSLSRFKAKPGKFLGREQFVEFDEVWSTLEPILADIVTYNVGNELVDAFTLMDLAIQKLEIVKPYLAVLRSKIAKFDDGKKAEFVQAFSKVKLNFLVTEYDSNTKKYKIINATSTNSRDSKIRNEWGNNFKELFLKDKNKLSKEDIDKITLSQSELISSMTKFNKEIKASKGKNILQIIAENVEDVINVINSFGSDLTMNDFIAHIKLSGGDKNAYREMIDIYSGTKYFIDNILSDKTQLYVDKEFVNPFDNQEAIKALSRAKALFEKDIAENNILGNEGKSYFTYSLPSYVHNTINQWKGDNGELKELSTRIYNGNSLWLNHLLGTSKDNYGSIISTASESRDNQSKENISKLNVMLSSSFKTKGKNDGKDNKNISFVDAVNDNISKLLGHKIPNGKNYAQTIIPADKSRKIEIEGLPSFDSGIDFIDGEWYVSDKTINTLVGYYEDEYNRMKEASNEINSLPDEDLVVHYHTGAKNAFKSQLFPEFSPENLDKDSELFISLYGEDGLPLGKEDNLYSSFGLSDVQKSMLAGNIKDSLIERLNETVNEFEKSGIIKVDNEGKLESLSINEDIVNGYSGKYDKVSSLIGDYFMNSMISNVEYGKLFLGDPAYYKNMPDLIKRTPASYTDGLQLFLNKNDYKYFNQATVKGVEITSKYIDLIRSSVKDKSIADSYDKGKVNSTDAQAWITPNRWKFLKTRLGQWTPQHDKVWEKMNYVNPKTGVVGKRLTSSEMKLAAQPMKGVYFDLNTGRPVYLKYSQAVLIPQLVKSTPMQALLDKMTKDPEGNQLDPKDEIHEVITIDGIKVGAVAPSKIHNEDGNIIDGFELNSVRLKNRGWKLQQDLPTKLAHKTMTGSQIQKNILAGIVLDGVYNFNGKKLTGIEILKEIHDTVSKLSNLGKDNIVSKFEITVDAETGKMSIGNLDAVYQTLIDEFRSRGGSDNIINALEKEMPFDAIPQIRGKVENIFMSLMNKELTKIYTNGGAFIQFASFGLEEIDLKGTSGIKIVSKNYDGKGLKPPHKDPKTGKMMPGQILLPHSALISLFDKLDVDYNALSGEELSKYLTPDSLGAVGYRIPNQGLSSNDVFEIVGILPAGVGDTIIGYDAIPTKTGSDFDIDKMFLMLSNLQINPETNLIEKVSYDENSTNIESVQNKLIDLYASVLMSESAYDKVMTSIDADFFKDDIVNMFPAENLNNLKFYSPMYQMKTKFEYLSGKMGVAQTANQLVDHILNRTQNIRLDKYLGIGHKNLGNTKFDEEYDTDNNHLISDSISAFLNAYVDIAKDPYVSRGNHNAITAGTTFMLLRAGVPVEWVNRFIAQPILKELVELTKSSEGITSEDLKWNNKRVNPYEYLRLKYKIKEKESSTKDVIEFDKNVNKGKLEELIVLNRETPIEDFGENELSIQESVLNIFEFFLDSSKHFNESVSASKTPGAGDFAQLFVAQNTFNSVIDKAKVFGFKNKFKNTMTGTYKENGLDWVMKLASDNKLFLNSNRSIHNTVNSISERTGRGRYVKNEDFVKSIFNNYYSYMLSGFAPFKENKNNFNKLFKETPVKLREMKLTSKNFLVSELEVKESDGINFIKLNSKNKPKSYNNKIYRAWVELLTSKSKEDVDLGINLVKYAYSQSGFQNNINQFFTHIPHEFLLTNGIDEYISNSIDDMNNIDLDINFRDQLFRHNADDNKLVPKVSPKNLLPVANLGLSNGFAYDSSTEKGKNSIKIGVNEDGFDMYPEFVSLKYLTKDVDLSKEEKKNAVYDNNLYKLHGGFFKESNGVKQFFPIYVRTFKLGLSSNAGKVFEFSFGEEVNNSDIFENNITGKAKERAEKLANISSNAKGFISASYLMGTLNENSKYNIDYEEQDNTSEDPFEC